MYVNFGSMNCPTSVGLFVAAGIHCNRWKNSWNPRLKFKDNLTKMIISFWFRLTDALLRGIGRGMTKPYTTCQCEKERKHGRVRVIFSVNV